MYIGQYGKVFIGTLSRENSTETLQVGVKTIQGKY